MHPHTFQQHPMGKPGEHCVYYEGISDICAQPEKSTIHIEAQKPAPSKNRTVMHSFTWMEVKPDVCIYCEHPSLHEIHAVPGSPQNPYPEGTYYKGPSTHEHLEYHPFTSNGFKACSICGQSAQDYCHGKNPHLNDGGRAEAAAAAQSVKELYVEHYGAAPVGRKDDADKDRYDLLPTGALAEVVKVLTCGAKKYAPENWRKVEGYRWRYFAAAMRHLWAWKRGQSSDPESGCHHLAHAICCLMFLMELSVLEELEGSDRG